MLFSIAWNKKDSSVAAGKSVFASIYQ